MFRLTVIKGKERKQRYLIREGRIVIGSGDDAGIRLDDPKMADRHAEITVEDGEPILRVLDKRRRFLLNKQSVRETVLHHGDILTIGETELAFEVSSKHPVFAPRRMHHMQRIALAAVGTLILAELLFLGGLYLWRRADYTVTAPEKKEKPAAEPEIVPSRDERPDPLAAADTGDPEVPVPAEDIEPLPAPAPEPEPPEPVPDVSPETPPETEAAKAPVERPPPAAPPPEPSAPEPAAAPADALPVEPELKPEPEPEPRMTVIDGPGSVREQRKAPEPPAPEPPRFVPSSPDDFMKPAAPYLKQRPRQLAIEAVEPQVHMLATNRWMVTLNVELINRTGRMLSVSEDIHVRTGYYYTDAETQSVVPAVQYIPNGRVNLRRNWKAGDTRTMYRAHIPPFERKLNYRGFIAAVYLHGQLQDVWTTDESLLESHPVEEQK